MQKPPMPILAKTIYKPAIHGKVYIFGKSRHIQMMYSTLFLSPTKNISWKTNHSNKSVPSVLS